SAGAEAPPQDRRRLRAQADTDAPRRGLQAGRLTDNLARLRRRLTIWYALTLGTIVVLLGAGLFIAIRSQISSQLNESLAMASAAIQRATSIREAEQASASGAVMDAVGELRIPDRDLYLFDHNARPLVPSTAPAAIAHAARTALQDSTALLTLYPPNDHVLRVSGAVPLARRKRLRVGCGRRSARARRSVRQPHPGIRRSRARRTRAICRRRIVPYTKIDRAGGAYDELHAAVHGRCRARAPHAVGSGPQPRRGRARFRR